MQTNLRLKLVILFYDSPACNKEAEILPLATALVPKYAASLIML